MEVADDLDHPGIDPDIFRAAPAGDVDGVVVVLADVLEALVEAEEMAELLGVGLVALEIMQAGLDQLAGLLVRADHVDGVADRLHGLLKDENLVFLAELADQHQDRLTGHRFSSLSVRRPCHGTPVRLYRGRRARAQ